jgi:hypothetical protein
MLWTLLAARTNPSGHCSEDSARRTSSTHWCRAKRASTKASCRNLSCGRLNQSFDVHRAQKPSTAALNVSGLCHRARATRAASISPRINGVPEGSSSSSNSGLIGLISISLSFRSSSISSILLQQRVHQRTQRDSPRRGSFGEIVEHLGVQMDRRHQARAFPEELAAFGSREVVFVLHQIIRRRRRAGPVQPAVRRRYRSARNRVHQVHRDARTTPPHRTAASSAARGSLCGPCCRPRPPDGKRIRSRATSRRNCAWSKAHRLARRHRRKTWMPGSSPA